LDPVKGWRFLVGVYLVLWEFLNFFIATGILLAFNSGNFVSNPLDSTLLKFHKSNQTFTFHLLETVPLRHSLICFPSFKRTDRLFRQRQTLDKAPV
jgi:hypothetical protein